MNKRLLSILLVLCMVLVSVPVFAFSASAAGNETKLYEYATSYTDNLPTANTTGDNPLVFTGNWSVGAHWPASYKTPASYVTWSWSSNAGNYVGVATMGNKAFYNYENPNPNYYGAIGSVGTFSSCYATVRYVAEKKGTIDIAFDQLGNDAPLVGGTFGYAIIVDGVQVWPTDADWKQITKVATGEYYNGEADKPIYADNYVFEETTVVASGIQVDIGSVVDFVSMSDADVTNTTYTNGGNKMFPTILYSSITPTHQTSFNSTSNLPVLNSDGSVSYKGNWEVFTYPKENNNGAGIYSNDASNSWRYQKMNAACSIPNAGGICFSSRADKWGASMDLDGGQPNNAPVAGSVAVSSACSVVIRYTAEFDGTIDVILDKVGNLSGWASDAAFDISNYRYGVFINHQMVWPATSGTLRNTAALDVTPTTGANAYKSDVLAATGIEVKTGDHIEFVIEGYKTNIATDWGGGANVMFGTIKYTQLDVDKPILYSSVFTENFPTVSADGTAITYNGNWTAWAYHKETWGGAGLYNPVDDWRYKPMNTATTTPLAGYFQPENSNFQGNGGAMISTVDNHANQAPAIGSFAVGNNCSAVLRYTAEKTGTVNIILDKVGNVSGDAAFNSNNFRYGVFVNGTMVWPVAGGTLNTVPALTVNGTGANQIATNIAAATDIKVKAGDRIEFICEQVLGNNNAIPTWGGAGNVMFGRINYTQVMGAPTATATVNVGPTVSATANVLMPNTILFEASKGIYVDGVKMETNEFLTNVAIKDISETVSVQPYYTTTQGEEVKGDAVEVSIAQLLQSISGSNAQAAAVLNYAAAAQKYFNITGTDLTYTAATVNGNYENNLKVVNPIENARVIPQQVALLLKETVSFKFTVEGAVEGDVMQISDGVNEAVTVDIVDGVAIFDDIAVTNWNTTYTFTVLDAEGTPVCSFFTYSVSTYYVRMMANTTDASLMDLVTAMMALYETTL